MQVTIATEVNVQAIQTGDVVFFAGERQGPAMKPSYRMAGYAGVGVWCVIVKHDLTGEPHALAFTEDMDVPVEASVDLKESDLAKSPRDILVSRNSEAALAELRRKLSGE